MMIFRMTYGTINNCTPEVERRDWLRRVLRWRTWRGGSCREHAWHLSGPQASEAGHLLLLLPHDDLCPIGCLALRLDVIRIALGM